MAPLLEARNVSKVFGSGDQTTVALDRFTLVVNGEVPSFTAVAGESGSGKTTLARLLLGFAQPTSGQILYHGRDLWQMKSAEWREFRREVQAVFQDPFEVFNPFYRVDHLLSTPIEKFRLAKSKDEARFQMEQALKAVGLRPEETLGRFPHQLSGGQRQRLTIARALLLHPKLIIADEPVSMVDASLRATILESLNNLYTQFGISFLYITHDLTTAYQISNNIIILYRGAVAEVGDVDRVIRDPQHPYSRLLIASIPEANVDHRWGEEQALPSGVERKGRGRNRCNFVDRCPVAMAKCSEQVPPMYRTDVRRATACFRYETAPVLAAEDMGQVLAAGTPTPAS
jgi:oligopeptide/dipeptide ABC transporter ATP-binding protein